MHWEKIYNIVRNEKTWTIITVLSGTVTSIVALFIVIYTVNTWKEQIESNRPYFTITKPAIIQSPHSPRHRIQIIIENVGIRPAYDLYGKIFIIDKDIRSKPRFAFELSIANEIPAKTPIPWYNDGLRLSTEIPPQYVVFAIEYNDPILKKLFEQIFYMKWNGVVEGQPDSSFVHVSIDEKVKIQNRINVIFKDFE